MLGFSEVLMAAKCIGFCFAESSAIRPPAVMCRVVSFVGYYLCYAAGNMIT